MMTTTLTTTMMTTKVVNRTIQRLSHSWISFAVVVVASIDVAGGGEGLNAQQTLLVETTAA
jgi:hypothetical protein